MKTKKIAKKIDCPQKQEKHIKPDFYVVIDYVTEQILASFDKNVSWTNLSTHEFGFEYLKDVEQSARFKSLEKANEAIEDITKEMSKAGETEFNFEVIGIKSKKITIEKVEGIQTMVDRLGIA